MQAKQKQSTSKVKAHKPQPVHTGGFKDRNLMGVNPLKEQFEPTAAEPVRQRARMAGA